MHLGRLISEPSAEFRTRRIKVSPEPAARRPRNRKIQEERPRAGGAQVREKPPDNLSRGQGPFNSSFTLRACALFQSPTAWPKATGKSRRTLVDPTFAANERGKRFTLRFVFGTVTEHARPLVRGSELDLRLPTTSQDRRRPRVRSPRTACVPLSSDYKSVRDCSTRWAPSLCSEPKNRRKPKSPPFG